MSKAKAHQPNRLARLDFRPIKATFGSAPPPAAKGLREPFDAAGKALLEQFAAKLSLLNTARDFPHVINRLGALSYRPAQMTAAIDKLLIGDRPGRQGFPFAVVTELSELREFYARLLK